jgi:hypothetical protein
VRATGVRGGPERAGASTPASRFDLLLSDPRLLSVLVAAFAALVLWLVVSPLSGVRADTDAAATVLYFERIVNGHRLEAFFPTTPKPLLTIVYGAAWSITGDWRTLTLLTLVVAALSVGMAARLAARLGGVTAAAIVVVAMLAWPDFQAEVAHANSFIWGLGLWLLAALLVTADRPRPWLAGIVLGLAGLARTETVWLIGAAMAWAAWLVLQALRGRRPDDMRLALPLCLGALFVPLACLHDWLLTGQPLYWLGVPAGFTALAYPDLASASPLATLHRESYHFQPAIPLLALAAVGAVRLALSQWRGLAFALLSLLAGVLLALVVLAWRAVYISPRYYEEADAAVLIFTAIGGAAVVTWLLGPGIDLARRRTGGLSSQEARPSSGAALPPAAGQALRTLGPAAVALMLTLAVVAVDVPQGTSARLTDPSTRAYADVQSALPSLRPILAAASGSTTRLAGASYPVVDLEACQVFVPRHFIPTISIDTGAPITTMGDNWLAFGDGDYSVLRAGDWVLHVAPDDGSGGVWAPFETSAPHPLDAGGRPLLVVPVVARPQDGWWLLRIDAAD